MENRCGKEFDIKVGEEIADLDIDRQIESSPMVIRPFFGGRPDRRDTSTVVCFEGEEERDNARTGRDVRNAPFDQPFDLDCSKTTATMYEDCVLQSMRFPQKLWQIVNECKTGAIRWSASGDTILVDYKQFQAEYLDARRPIFKTNNITSFIRQLNLYGFRKITCHGRDPACNSCNPHVHEFLHDNFRIDRIDLLSKVCRKAGGRIRCMQHETAKNPEENPQSETNRMSRLKQCQLALTKALEEISQEYRRKRDEEKQLIIRKDNTPKRIRNSEGDIVPVLYEIEFNSVPNRKSTIERNVEYLRLLPLKDQCSI
ncbi:heat shock transcription factor, X-linked member 4 [Monomorium pharaonis]|uniref:heat shock transcription factor, X-linked member 4 n=1 Tax=Monomorium pharaonis TaxID=307658 RepID=UPI00063F7F01|nr:heat shock transcription factor, X-linked member 4 [Monomorium pharaonis]